MPLAARPKSRAGARRMPSPHAGAAGADVRRPAARGSAGRPRRRRRGRSSRASRGRRSGRSPWRCPRARARRRRRWPRAPPRRPPASSSPPSIAARPSASTIAAALAALGDEPVEHLARRADADRAWRRPARRAPRAPAAGTTRVARDPAVVEPRHQLAGDPVGERLRRRRRLARRRRARPRSSRRARRGTRAAARSPRSAPSSRCEALARVGGQLGHRRARGLEHLPRRSRRAAGRARGSSGSRAPPPWSAAR